MSSPWLVGLIISVGYIGLFQHAQNRDTIYKLESQLSECRRDNTTDSEVYRSYFIDDTRYVM